MRDSIVIIAVVLIALLLVGPTFMSGLGDFGDKLAEWVKFGDGIDENGNGVNDFEAEQTQGQMCVGVTVQFKDGTQHTVGPEDITFTLFPFTVFFEDKEVSKIKFYFYMLVDWTGELKSLAVDGNMQIEVGKTVDYPTLTCGFISINKVYTDVPKNEWFAIGETIIDADKIEVVGQGDWLIFGHAIVDVSAEFPTATDERHADTKFHIPINIEFGLTVFSIQITPQVLNP